MRALECDGCGVRLPGPHLSFRRAGYIVGRVPGTGVLFGGDVDFCDYECMAKWALKEQAAEDSSGRAA